MNRALSDHRCPLLLDQGPATHTYVLAERLPGPKLQTKEQLFDQGCADAKTDHHPVGTCKMGTGTEAVVDLALRLHGLRNLRVLGAARGSVVHYERTDHNGWGKGRGSAPRTSASAARGVCL